MAWGWFGRAAAELRAWRVHTDTRLAQLEERQRSIETNQIALGTQMDVIEGQLTGQQVLLERADRYVTSAVRERKQRRVKEGEDHHAKAELASQLLAVLLILLGAALAILLLQLNVQVLAGIVGVVLILCGLLIRHHISLTRPLPPDEDDPP